jgi:hypothetical protein
MTPLTKGWRVYECVLFVCFECTENGNGEKRTAEKLQAIDFQQTSGCHSVFQIFNP